MGKREKAKDEGKNANETHQAPHSSTRSQNLKENNRNRKSHNNALAATRSLIILLHRLWLGSR
jgi:hypothetical protein